MKLKELFNTRKSERDSIKIAIARVDKIIESEELVEKIIVLKKIKKIIERL